MITVHPSNPHWETPAYDNQDWPCQAGEDMNTNRKCEQNWNSVIFSFSNFIPVLLPEKSFLNVSYKRRRTYEVTAGQSILKMGIRVDAFPRPSVTWWVESSFLGFSIIYILLTPSLKPALLSYSRPWTRYYGLRYIL